MSETRLFDGRSLNACSAASRRQDDFAKTASRVINQKR